MVESLNPHWFGYPSGYYYFLLGLLPIRFLSGVLTGKWVHPRDLNFAYLQDPMVLAPLFRVAGILASVLAILFTCLAAEKIVGRRWAWLAGLFLAVSPFASHWSIQIWPEALIILPAAVCLYFGVRYSETGALKHILACGLAAGAAVSVKYNAVYLWPVIPCAAWACAGLHRVPNGRSAWRHVGLASLASLVGFLALTPFAALDWRRFIGGFSQSLSYKAVVHVGLDVGHELMRTAPWLWWLRALNGITPGFFWVAGFAVLLALVRWKKQYLVLVGPAFVMVPFLTWFGAAEFYHLVPILPVAACGLCVAASVAESLAGRFRHVVFPLACVICLPGLQLTLMESAHRTLPDTRIEARRWIEANVPNGSRVLLDKHEVPYLVRSREQVECILSHLNGKDRPFGCVLDMPRTVFYWAENLPVAVDSRETGRTDDGRVMQPRLPTPAEYAAAGFEYVVLSAGTYERFFYDSRYKQVREYYQSLFAQADVVYEVDGNRRPGPKITILRLKPVSPVDINEDGHASSR
jgi:hypothetical protein